jgi:glycosyltransferase involved in cell wall biosynthesis
MKIYFITSKLNFKSSGGSIEEFDLMMRTLQSLGNEVVCITTFTERNDIFTPLPYEMIEENIPYHGLLQLQYGVYRIMRKYEHDADFFHVDGHLFLYGAGVYRKLGGRVPVSAFFNRELISFPEDRSVLISVAQRSLLRRAKRSLRRLLESTIGMYLARAIDMRSFISPMYQIMYERFGLTNNGHHFVLGDPIDFPKMMGENGITATSYKERLKTKGPLMLAGFARVKNKENYKLVLGGSGPEEEKIHRLAKELNIEKHVEFLGWLTKEQLYENYKKADVFIQVGWRPEGTSMSLLYAIAFGLPSIVPSESGMAWQAQKSALTVENGNHEALARAIERLGEDPKLREELSHNCFIRINEDQLNHKKIIALWFNEMKKIKDLRSLS